MTLNIQRLRQATIANKYEISWHAQKERYDEDISLVDIEEVIKHGEIIEQYPQDPRGASCLVLGFSHRRAVHIVCTILPNGWLRIITVYIPQMPKWINPKQRNR